MFSSSFHGRLQLIADGLMERFRAAGLARVDFDRVKIHATLMNCAFWKDFDVQGRTSEVTSYFDSRPIMEVGINDFISIYCPSTGNLLLEQGYDEYKEKERMKNT